MPWVSLKAFALSPRPTYKSFSGSFPALPIPQRAQKSGSAWAPACHPGTVCSSAEQEYKGGGWAGFWEVEHRGINSKRQKGVISRWAVAAVTSWALNTCSAKQEVFLWTSGNKRHRAGRHGWGNSSAISILQKPPVPNPTCLRSSLVSWVTATSEPSWEPEGKTEISRKVFQRRNFSVNRSDERTTLQLGFTEFRPTGRIKEEGSEGKTLTFPKTCLKIPQVT